jgi:hypothetical protein
MKKKDTAQIEGVTNDKNPRSTSAEFIRIVGSVFYIDRNETFLEVEYSALDGTTKFLRVPRELSLSPTKFADVLMKTDANLSDPVKAVKAALIVKSNRYREMTRRTGWHEGKSFVYPTKTFGKLSERLLYDRVKQIPHWAFAGERWMLGGTGLRNHASSRIISFSPPASPPPVAF